jgi:membrane protease YdiL (CAAX protease family)
LDQPDRRITWVAWGGGILVATALPGIAWQVAFSQRAPLWLAAVNVGMGAALFVLTYIWDRMRRLRLAFLVLAAEALGFAINSFIGQTPAWQAWVLSVPAGLGFAVANDLKLIPVALLTAVVIGSGLSRKQIFLQIGDLQAPAGLPFTDRLGSWVWLGPVVLLAGMGEVVIHVTVTRGPSFASVADAILPLVLVILAGAAINAFCEEFLFRSVLLAALTPVLGPGQSLTLTSLRFGLGHWSGNPSGPVGVLLAGVFGWLLGKSMFDTRGMGWAFLIHWVSDVAIFSLIALTAPSLWSP